MAAKDNLKDLLQERFTDHEVGVDPGLWQAISGQLVAAAPAADGLSELLKDRFQQHEVQVDPGTWAQISSQLGHGAAAGTVGGSGLGGWMAAGIAATLLTGGLLFWASRPDAPAPTTTAQVQATVASTTPSGKAASDASVPNGTPPANNTPELVSPVPAERAATRDSGTPGVPQFQQPATPAAAPAERPDEPAASNPKEQPGDHLPEVNMILERLIEQTKTDPVIAQTESIPEVGLVQGLVDLPEEGDDGAEDPPPPSPTAAPLVWIPNTFSSNGDGVNDALEVKAEGLNDLQVRIYSLSNQLVFRANDLRAWDGRDMSGQLCAEGYYFYAIEGLDGNGKPYSKGQTVRLFR
jgi:hypothetical protein